jgi:glycosyltransferase involved in cell wall biosynthesis
MSEPMITVIIPTKDEAVHIERCVESLLPLGRVVVVDSESEDDTVDRARRAGADVFVHAWEGYAAQKNWALSNTNVDTPWILLMDADEFVTEETRRAIRKTAERGDAAGYWLPRRMIFLGREMRYAWWYPDFQLRLVRTGMGSFEPRSVHEHLVVDGPVKELWADIWHENLKGLTAFVERHNRYATLEAAELDAPSQDTRSGSFLGNWADRRRAIKSRVWTRLPGRPLIRFLWLYFVRQGFRDGREGFIYCSLIAWYDLLINAKVLEHEVESRAYRYSTSEPHPRAKQLRAH